MIRHKKIKIVAIECGHLSKQALSGGDILLEKMAPYLLGKIDLSVITPKIAMWHWKKIKKAQIVPLARNILDENSNKLAIFSLYLIRSWQTYKKILTLNFDIIYSSSNSLPDILPAYIYKIARHREKWIARVHHLIPSPMKREGSFFTNLLSYYLENLLLKLIKKSDLTIALNPSLLKELQLKGFNPQKLAVVGGGVNIKRIRSINTSGPKYDAIFIGRVHKTKGIIDLLEIWGRLTKNLPKAKLAIAGEIRPELSKILKRGIKKKNLQKNITILGYVNEKKLIQSLKNSRVFLFTDKEAGFSLATAQAMAAGIPVVAYNLPFFRSIYKNVATLVPTNDNQAFAKSTLGLLKNKKRHAEMSRKSIIFANDLDWQHTSANLISQLNKLIDS